MTRPERYQLPFEFGRKSDSSSIYYEIGFAGRGTAEESSGRFVRKVKEEIRIRTPVDAAQHFLDRVFTPFDAFDQEELWGILLNTKNRITHEAMIYRGTVNTIHLRQAELFKEAVRVNASALVLSHIHPSGHVLPSPEDIRVTEDAFLAGRLLGIDLLDHIIVGRDTWLSLRTQGLGFPQNRSASD
ncbi:MAG: JAB domain-containing protein [Caldilineaceae bacterium]|nr:JAB domain-containing protein [Caldilineaceae bacterium]